MSLAIIFSFISISSIISPSCCLQEIIYKSPLLTPWTGDVTPENAWREYPRPQMRREKWMSLNGLWNYTITPLDQADLPDISRGKILVPFCIESYLSGVESQEVSFDNLLWYSREFKIPAEWEGNRIRLNFEAVDYEAVVYINGYEAASHVGGYDRFSADITDFLLEDINRVIVKVYDPTQVHPIAAGKQVRDEHHPGEIFYTPVSGIWQSVWLEPLPSTYIQTLKVDTDKAVVNLTVKIAQQQQTELEATLLDGNTTVGTVSGLSEEDGLVRLSIPVEQARLWSPQDPFLYDLKLRLTGVNGEVDEVASYLGIRTIRLQTDENGFKQFFLNDEEIFFQFGPLDQGFWPDGIYTAPTLEALKWDLIATKDLGFNMIRKHIKVEPELWYYWADKLGLLIWQDFPAILSSKIYNDLAAKEQFRAEIVEWVEEKYNHPAIILWVVFNEGWGQHDTVNVTQFARDQDQTRIITDASGWVDYGVGDVLDFHCYPGPLCHGEPGVPDPNRAMVLGEFWGRYRVIPGHSWFGDDGQESGLTEAEFLELYEENVNQLLDMRELGYSAAVLTQTTDVEGEMNGLFTYDRVKEKADLAKLKELNLKLTGKAAKKYHVEP